MSFKQNHHKIKEHNASEESYQKWKFNKFSGLKKHTEIDCLENFWTFVFFSLKVYYAKTIFLLGDRYVRFNHFFIKVTGFTLKLVLLWNTQGSRSITDLQHKYLRTIYQGPFSDRYVLDDEITGINEWHKEAMKSISSVQWRDTDFFTFIVLLFLFVCVDSWIFCVFSFLDCARVWFSWALQYFCLVLVFRRLRVLIK